MIQSMLLSTRLLITLCSSQHEDKYESDGSILRCGALKQLANSIVLEENGCKLLLEVFSMMMTLPSELYSPS